VTEERYHAIRKCLREATDAIRLSQRGPGRDQWSGALKRALANVEQADIELQAYRRLGGLGVAQPGGGHDC